MSGNSYRETKARKAAEEVVSRIAAESGFKADIKFGSIILSKSKTPDLYVYLYTESVYPLSPIAAKGHDAEMMREKFVDALITEGLLA